MFDFTATIGDLQGVLAGAVTATFVFALKFIFLGIAVQVATLFLPRWLRPLVPLAALTLLLTFPAQLSQLGDAILTRAGLLPQAAFPVVPAGASAPGLAGSLTGLQAQVQGTLDSFTSWFTAQLGL